MTYGDPSTENQNTQNGTDFLLANGELLASVKKAVQPFNVELHQSIKGPRISGDKAAILILKRVLDALISRDDAIASISDASSIHALTDQVIEHALCHELALRLHGIHQPIRPRSLAQLKFAYDLIDPSLPLIFGLGPTGTGKTFLAVVAALNQLAKGTVKHITITKPHEMQSGEVMTAETRAERQIDHQFQVYFDIFIELIGQQELESLLDSKRLEIVPLGYLRGRTLSHSFIMIDEAHNMDKRWMRLAATRAGENARTIILGEASHKSLPSGEVNGLDHLLDLVRDQAFAKMHAFKTRDIVRNETVARLEELYAHASRDDVDLAFD
jgi:phosphate starvation-inducible PhoH-like protein